MGCLSSREPVLKFTPVRESALELDITPFTYNRAKTRFMMINSDNIYHDYTIHKKLGRGAFGSVYLSTHKRTGLERAVKKIAKSNLEDPSRMLEEVEILMDLVRVI